MDHNNQIYSWLLCVERSWSPETTREKKTVRTVAHRGACVVYYIHYGSPHPNLLLVVGCREKEHCPTLHCPTPNGTIVPSELSPPMRSALRRVADARVPSAPFKCKPEMSGKTVNGW